MSPGDVNIDKDKVFQSIQAHQEKAARLPPVEEIRSMIFSGFWTFHLTAKNSNDVDKHEGYPSGSMVDLTMHVMQIDLPILAVSNLAIHTKDLIANPKCSLLLARDPEDRTDLVITLHDLV
ncbi:hypothetical protein K1719_003011 [Acacia pycnantha]|nr:hypothetical protein K1719_003011 [Acacia pycnantha]